MSDTEEMYSIPTTSVPGGNLQEKGEEMKFKEIMAEKFQKIRKIL